MSRALTIALEGATYQGSVALLEGAQVVAERTIKADDGGMPRAGRGERLMPALAECMDETGAAPFDIGRIICGAGPGSFTSLRVAGSVAKGLAVGYGVSLYAVSSLLLTVAGAQGPLAPGPYLSLLDAMRGEWFALRVTVETDESVKAMGRLGIVRGDDIDIAQSRESNLRVIGPGQQVDMRPHARGVGRLLDSIVARGPVDLASWEPDYGRLAEAQVRWEAEHGRSLVP